MRIAMCGRFFLSKSGAEMLRHFDLSQEPVLAPRFNIAPTQSIAFVRELLRSEPGNQHLDPIVPRSEAKPSGEIHEGAARVLEARTWGFVPHFAKAPSEGPRSINARAETVATTPLFRDAFASRRGLVPASGFYEWQHRGRSSRPFAIRVRGGELFAMAALYDHWQRDGAALDSCAIVTTDANERIAPVHDRMPVILAPADYALWLDPAVRDPERLLPLLRPCPAEWIDLHPVDRRVNDVRCDDAQLADPERDLFSFADGGTS